MAEIWSFGVVFARGRARIGSEIIGADRRVYQIGLPRHPPFASVLDARVGNETVQIPLIDALGMIHSVSREDWMSSGSRAWLVALADDVPDPARNGNAIDRIRQQTRSRSLSVVELCRQTGWVSPRAQALLYNADLAPQGDRPGPHVKPLAKATKPTMQAWSQRLLHAPATVLDTEALAAELGWEEKLVRRFFLTPKTRLTITECLEAAAAFDLAPSQLFSKAPEGV